MNEVLRSRFAIATAVHPALTLEHQREPRWVLTAREWKRRARPLLQRTRRSAESIAACS